MGLFGFGKDKREHGHTALIFDIGSATVGVALAYTRPNEKHSLLYSDREDIKSGRSKNISHLISAMQNALKRVTEKAYKEGLKHLTFTSRGSKRIDHVFFVFSGAWTLSKTTEVVYKKDKPFEVDYDLIDRLIAKEMKQFEKDKMFQSGEKIKVLERVITSVKLNGYKTSRPAGKVAQELSFDIYASVMPEKLYEEVEYIVESLFHTHESSAHSFALVATAIAREEGHEDFALVDVSGALTEITMVDDGNPVATATFALGARDIIHQVADEISITVDEAESLVREQGDTLVASDRKQKFKTALEGVKTKWLEEFENALRNIPGFITLPSSLLIAADPDTAVIIDYFLASSGDNRPGILNPSTKISEIPIENLRKAISVSEGVVPDSFLLFETAFVGKVKE